MFFLLLVDHVERRITFESAKNKRLFRTSLQTIICCFKLKCPFNLSVVLLFERSRRGSYNVIFQVIKNILLLIVLSSPRHHNHFQIFCSLKNQSNISNITQTTRTFIIFPSISHLGLHKAVYLSWEIQPWYFPDNTAK